MRITLDRWYLMFVHYTNGLSVVVVEFVVRPTCEIIQ